MGSVAEGTFVPEPYDFEGYTIFRREDGIIQITFREGFAIALEDAARSSG